MDEIPAVEAKREVNMRIWIGFVVAIVAFASYMLIFARFPITRDVPWVNWLLFVLAGWLLWNQQGVAVSAAMPRQDCGSHRGGV